MPSTTRLAQTVGTPQLGDAKINAIAYLRSLGRIAIVLVEQYLDFARELGDRVAVMDRGAVVCSCSRDTLDEGTLRRAMAI